MYKNPIEMKTYSITLAIILASIVFVSQAQYLPATELKTLDGKTILARDILEEETLTILVFWKTCDARCCQNLEAMQQVWLDSLQGRGVNFIGICVDGIGSWSHVKPYIDGNCFEFDAYVDVNCELKREMGVVQVPSTILLDREHNLICRYSGFCTGADKMVCERLEGYYMASLER